ncbi:MAG: hypothetical protein GQ569_13995 [Methylococcaceae bacterium]|nr:hypothetical protein [Methylococcaceae bacterium]
MSFAEQERALFDLIFDHPLREQFCDIGLNALISYQLSDEEREDFSTIRPEALALDAQIRINLILSRFCRELPLSFGMVSSLKNGKAMLQALVDTQTMTSSAEERVPIFATRLREKLVSYPFPSIPEHQLAMAITEAELSMASTAKQLKAAVLKGFVPKSNLEIPEDCLDKPAKIADYVSVSVIPQSYSHLKTVLCPYALDELWKHLSHNPLSASQRREALQNQEPRLLIARAHIHRMSQCAPEVKHHTVELSDGFAALLHHLDGNNSINEVLEQFQQAGAPEQMIQGVRNGFLQLWKSEMLTLV